MSWTNVHCYLEEVQFYFGLRSFTLSPINDTPQCSNVIRLRRIRYRRAILLVDEINLHLHPAWQRDIISFLFESIFQCTVHSDHSPLVVQSIDKEVNLYVLHRRQQGESGAAGSNQFQRK